MIDREHEPRELGQDAAGQPTGTPVTVRLGSGGRGPAAVAVLIGVFVALALVKPWAGGAGAPHPIPRVPQAPVSAPSADPLADLRSHCQEPLGWRLYSRERWATMTVRSWKSLDPAFGASGPLDPGIPILPLGAPVDALGYCSPWTGGERPPADASVSGWRITPETGYGATMLADPIALRPVDPGWPSVLGALYGPPVNRFDSNAVETPGWPGGRYVFAIRAPGFARWWGVLIVPPPLASPTPAAAPNGGPPASATPASP
jgi:hypothetical protein